jgi:hypothetical protein
MVEMIEGRGYKRFMEAFGFGIEPRDIIYVYSHDKELGTKCVTCYTVKDKARLIQGSHDYLGAPLREPKEVLSKKRWSTYPLGV